MGVQNLWKALSKDGAVETLEGNQSGHHARIVDAVENKVVAVDLSAWLMQAQSQPALLEHYDSPYARAVKVVFDRTIHWLRYGCLPVFVIEGRTPEAKLDKLRARCVAQYGPSSYTAKVGNREGGQFDRLGQAVKRLLDAFGVPCVQAVGEAEAMCAALNVCGWAHAVHTADVDALLFGALTVYRQMHLQTDDPRRSTLTRCCMYDVRRALGISRGGDAALMAVAHLAGGDYDTGGADNVGEALALGAVRQLLTGCQDDELVLQKLEAAIARGPDPELEALTKCTGCKVCGHEGNRKNRINAHSAKNGCVACGCEDGCKPRDWTVCECAFHARADERLLNRVVKRAVATPNFMASFKTAASAYAEQTRSAIASIQREYGLPAPGSSRNVFSWSCRPDVRAISDIMCRYIKEWDYRQVRLKLLPLLLEWDVRQGPSPGPSLRPLVQFRPSSIRKVSSKGAEAAELTGVPTRQQQGWRYVLLVDRLPGGSQQPAAAAGRGAAGMTQDAATEDLAVDQSWIAGTARSRPPKQSPPAPASVSAAAAAAGGGDSVDLLGGDDTYEGEPFLATQMPGTQAGLGSPMAVRTLGSSQQQSPLGSRAFSSSQQQPLSQGGGGAASGGGGGGSLQFAEHRSVRCNLIDVLWPNLTAAFRQPAVSGGRARSGGAGRKKQAAAASGRPTAADVGEDKQRTVKDLFGVVKDYTAPGRQSSKLPAAEGGSIPGLAGLSGVTSTSRGAAVAAAAAAGPAAAAAEDSQAAYTAGLGLQGSGRTAAASGGGTPAAKASQQSFMEWLHQEEGQQPQQQQPEQPNSPIQQQGLQHKQQQQHKPWPQQQQAGKQQQGSGSGRRGFTGMQATQTGGGAGSGSSRARKKQAAVAKTPCKAGPLDRFMRPAAAGSSRARKKQAAVAKTPCKAGPLDRFMRPAAAAAGGSAGVGSAQIGPAQVQEHALANQQHQQDEPVAGQTKQQEQQQHCSGFDCDSPEVPSLAARLAAKAAAARLGQEPVYRSSPRSRHRSDSGIEADAAAATGRSSSPVLAPPAKKVSTPMAKELLSSPAKTAAAAAAGSSPAGQGVGAAGHNTPDSRYYSQYESLLAQMGVASPNEQQGLGPKPGSRAVKGLFSSQRQGSAARGPAQLVQPQPRQEPECIQLLDSPMPLAAAAATAAAAPAGSTGSGRAEVEVVDLT